MVVNISNFKNIWSNKPQKPIHTRSVGNIGLFKVFTKSMGTIINTGDNITIGGFTLEPTGTRAGIFLKKK